MATNESTIKNLEEIERVLDILYQSKLIKKCSIANLRQHIAQQKRQMNKGY